MAAGQGFVAVVRARDERRAPRLGTGARCCKATGMRHELYAPPHAGLALSRGNGVRYSCSAPPLAGLDPSTTGRLLGVDRGPRS